MTDSVMTVTTSTELPVRDGDDEPSNVAETDSATAGTSTKLIRDELLC